MSLWTCAECSEKAEVGLNPELGFPVASEGWNESSQRGGRKSLQNLQLHLSCVVPSITAGTLQMILF